MKTKVLLSIFIILFGLTSCKKSEPEERMITIKGIVLNCDNNEVFPNTEILMLKSKYMEDHDDIDYYYYIEPIRSITNNNGEYVLTFPYKDKDMLHPIFAYKNDYIQKNSGYKNPLDNCSLSELNNDTILLGKATYLNVVLNNFTGNKGFIIDLNKNIPSELFDPTADYNTCEYYIDNDDTVTVLKESYLSKDNHNVYVTWSRYNKKHDDTTVVVQMNPSDTTFLSIDLQ
ncbi:MULTISPECIES: hypothetical protein [unclassified Lentimicrobium]|uniref:hypothetical protein n=1 Tax=unclassified Lentimicrobium TaxID=2677434 RepID=UPI001551C9E2|nr:MULTISPECIES: hypothetical protein [unclassified Lentimicrobium]NPD45021.1 hypothetical protein [Lentimicrobium sp. S6]NPD86043.1 hypothetical protein [Lentimicrobium sp. L6]